MNNNPSLDIAKKEIEKAIVSELCKKGVIDFCECNNITRKLDEDIIKLKDKLKIKEDMKNIKIKIPI